MKTRAKPFLKWAGGKSQLLSQLDSHLPEELKQQEFTYIEPFVGGGAMLFHLLQHFPHIKKAVINDINPYLITAYRVIKDASDELIKRLAELEEHYFAMENEDLKKSFYLHARTVFNESVLDDIDRTKYLIFLNRTCFNGLYRVNSKGKFNVPFGRYKNPTICNPEVIKNDSKLLNQIEVVIINGDFEQTQRYIDNGFNFFYFDPPYRPLNATSSFNSYAKEEFDDNEQIRLRNFCYLLSQQPNIKWILNNGDCSAKNPEDTFLEEIYRDFNINRLQASRAINANPNKRGKLTELLIKNYE